MPELGLSDNAGLEYRVYVLDCADSCLYVGIEVKAKLASRLKQHFVGGGAFFTKQHRPRALHLVWPAACTAVECYVYHALLAMQPAGRVERLGGWTQTSTKVSPLAALVFEQARRSLRGSCFNCGGPTTQTSARRRCRAARTRAQAARRRSSCPAGASPWQRPLPARRLVVARRHKRLRRVGRQRQARSAPRRQPRRASQSPRLRGWRAPSQAAW
jgi:hypothetical protein